MGRIMNLNTMSSLQQRLIIGAISTFVTLTVIYFSQHPIVKPILTLLLAAIVGGAMWELDQLAKVKGFKPNEKLSIILSTLYIITLSLSTQYSWANILPEILMLITLISCFLYYFARGTAPVSNLSMTLFGLSYLTIPLGCILLIAYFFPSDHPQDNRWWLLYLLTVTKIGDTGAFFIGREFGRHKLAPYISPKKTWEGAIGGLASATVASVLLAQAATILDPGGFSLSLFQSIWLGICVGIAAQLGDLAESLLKRDAGIKDSNQLPGLGGILDVVDSLVFTAPMVYIFLKGFAH